MSRNKTRGPSGGYEQADPFAGFGLTDEARQFFQADEPKAEKKSSRKARERKSAGSKVRDASPPRASKAAAQPAPEARFTWQPSDFEVKANPLPKNCINCFHFVRGGALAVEKIYDLKNSQSGDGFRLIQDCKSHERAFEAREIEETVEKAKALESEFDDVPRIRDYCIVGSSKYTMHAHIPEIKNHDGKCPDFLPGTRPIASCDKCTQLNEAYAKRPRESMRNPDLSDHYRLMRDPDLSTELMGRVTSSVTRATQQAEQRYEMEQQRYDQKLSDDVHSAIYNDRSPSNGTLDVCKDDSWRATAVVNRTGHCPRFTAGASLENIAGEVRWRQLAVENAEYRNEVAKVIDAWKAARKRLEDAEHGKKKPERPPCFSCVHWRAPIDIDPFRQVYYNDPQIMDLRDGYRREMKQREAEERRICVQPGQSLGGENPPLLQAWCDKYSTRSVDGKVQEYAYCLRVLRNARGNCPSFEKRGEDRDAMPALPPLPPPPRATPAPATSKPRAFPDLNFGEFKFPGLKPLDKTWLESKTDKPPAKESAAGKPSLSKFPLTATDLLGSLGEIVPPLPGKKPSLFKLEMKCTRCKAVFGVIPRSGRMWCISCNDWAAT